MVVFIKNMNNEGYVYFDDKMKKYIFLSIK